jgi:hypothetical protein
VKSSICIGTGQRHTPMIALRPLVVSAEGQDRHVCRSTLKIQLL